MEASGTDAWTRVDPVFNEGTEVSGRVVLQLQVMSDRVARRMSLAMHLLWLAIPAVIITLLMRYRMDPDRYVLGPGLHAPGIVLPSLVCAGLAALIVLLVTTWAGLRHQHWTIAQRRLVALRGGAVAVLALDSALIVLPNAAVLLRPCMYADTRGSLVRWAAVARQVLGFAFIGIKCTEVRSLLLCDPEKRHRDTLGIFKFCLPASVAAALVHALQRRFLPTVTRRPEPSVSTGAAPGPHGAASPAPPTTAEAYVSAAPTSQGKDQGAAAMQGNQGGVWSYTDSRRSARPDAPAAQNPDAACGAAAVSAAAGEGVHSSETHAAGGAGGTGGGGKTARTAAQAGADTGIGPYGQLRAPVVAMQEPLLLWTWHVWLVAIAGTAIDVAYGLRRSPLAEFRSGGQACRGLRGGAGCECALHTLQCSETSVSGSVAASVLLLATLICCLLLDLWRGNRRLRGRLYMPNRHTHALLSIANRFGIAAVTVFVVAGVAANLPGWEDETADLDVPWGEDLGGSQGGIVTPHACATYANIMFGNPATNAILAVIASVELALVWPMLATACKRPMHEHLQRFVWVDADLPAAKAARDKAALPLDTSEVPMFSMQRAVNLFFWASLAYKLTTAAHMHGSIDPAVASALGYSHRPAMAMYGLQRLRVFWEHRCDSKAVVAWGRRAIVIAWRGTSTLTNARMDLRMSRAPLPGVPACTAPGAPGALPVALSMCTPCGLLGMLCRSVPVTQPMVHSGFLATYQSSGLSQRLLMHVFSLLESGEVGRETCTIYVCGHSLGGALAILNSLDIAAGCRLRREQVVVYTIGCPRVGDRAFAQHANAAVPDTWHIINGRDLVTQWGKCAGFYKSSGQRVVIDSKSQLIVRPSFFEYVLHRLSGRSHLMEHLPGRYLQQLSLSLGRIQRLCTDPRESRRIARLLFPQPPSSSEYRSSANWCADDDGGGGGALSTSDSNVNSASLQCPCRNRQWTTDASLANPPADEGSACMCACAACCAGACRGTRVSTTRKVTGSGTTPNKRASGRSARTRRSGRSSRGRSRTKDGGSPTWSSIGNSGEMGSRGAAPVAFGDVMRAFCHAEQAGYESDHAAVASAIPDSPTRATSAGLSGPGREPGTEAEGDRVRSAGSASTVELPSVFANVANAGVLRAGAAAHCDAGAAHAQAGSSGSGWLVLHPPEDIRMSMDMDGAHASAGAEHAPSRPTSGCEATTASATGAASDGGRGASPRDAAAGVAASMGAERTGARSAELTAAHASCGSCDLQEGADHHAAPLGRACCWKPEGQHDAASPRAQPFAAVAERMLKHRR